MSSDKSQIDKVTSENNDGKLDVPVDDGSKDSFAYALEVMYLAGNSAALGGTEAPLVDIPRVDLRRTGDLVADTGGYSGPVHDEALDYITACLSQPKAKKRLPKKSVRTMDCPLDWDYDTIRSAYDLYQILL